MTSFNAWSIDRFNTQNVDIDQDTLSKHFDARLAHLYTHLDLQVIRRWILPHFKTRRPTILDVGAGKGRMTGHLAAMASRTVAIEPFHSHYEVLAKRFPEMELHRATLVDYRNITTDQFDMICVAGVLPYFNSVEMVENLKVLKRLLNPGGFVYLLDYGVEDSVSSKQDGIVLRSPSEIITAFRAAGLNCWRWRRAYPPSCLEYLEARWPNPLTKLLLRTITKPIFFSLWELFAALNLRHRVNSYFVYVLRA
jgi:SAM-dependent methyltransferase